ncbi:Inner membrane protein yohD [Fibrella aestuarina BUZ 2]|uniref:Inner membrane protein yohD n=1 Tax=Fibrella aestuarina BUZ 2 TaxID=1166018 RepID=I0KG87_9BACT|nr:DedA family protein [Fibrella aestuarina]CCH03140.1 Inner membrane protein yohD [Fibrella aestuarina BUZ 2]
MSFQELMLTYGYPILFVGVMLESEAFLIVAAYLAHRGYFSLPLVIGIAALSSFAVSQLCFYLGHRYGSGFISKRPAWQQRFARVQTLLHRYGAGLVFGYRALYGLRGFIPASLGLANYSRSRFLLINGLSAIVWAVVVALAGNSIAHYAESLYSQIRQHDKLVILGLLGLGTAWTLYKLYQQPSTSPKASTAGLLAEPKQQLSPLPHKHA